MTERMKIFINEKTGTTILASKNKNESCEEFYGRGYFMLKYIKYHNEKDMNEIIRMSHIWKNITYLHCEYSSEIMKKITDVQQAK
jgi:hypothetical protein